MGFCAEHSAISQMITNSGYKIKKIVAVCKDDDGNYLNTLVPKINLSFHHGSLNEVIVTPFWEEA